MTGKVIPGKDILAVFEGGTYLRPREVLMEYNSRHPTNHAEYSDIMEALEMLLKEGKLAREYPTGRALNSNDRLHRHLHVVR